MNHANHTELAASHRGDILDQFQRDALHALKAGQSVIVGAPPGAGKTQIAECLIDRCFASGGRVIYVPSGHRVFRRWEEQFGEKMGVVTTDIALRPDAPLCIMTPDAFRRAIFEHPAELEAFEYIIFDGPHHLSEVFEECLLLTPPRLRCLVLTLPHPNLNEMARWLEFLCPEGVIVISETERPVLLSHNLFIENHGVGTPETIEKIRGASPEARQKLLSQPDADVVKFICEHDQLPGLYFCDSRKRCENLAFNSVQQHLIPLHPDALSHFDEICTTHDIPQEKDAVLLRECIANGIAFHHAGLLPALTAIVEQLFGIGLVQLVFTTEQFAVEGNPAVKSVIIDGLEKFDGTRSRLLTPQEYHLMAGCAGRRGVDSRGQVYLCVDASKIDPSAVRQIINGGFDPFDSQLDPSYATLLNLYDSESRNSSSGESITFALQNSFRYFQSKAKLPTPTPDGQDLLPVECIYDQPHLIVEYGRLSESLAPQKAALKKSHRELKRAKRDTKAAAAVEAVDALETEIRQIETDRDALLCTTCDHRGECMQRSQKLQKAQREASRLAGQQTQDLDYLTPDEIDRRIAFLASLGYIRDGRLTAKGRCAKGFDNVEIQITELLFDGYFDLFDEVQVNILASALCFESRADAGYQPLDGNPLGFDSAALEKRIQRLAERQRIFGIQRDLKMLDFNLSGVVHAWSNGAEFTELSRFTDAADGDIVRGLYETIRLLRQLEGVLPEETELRRKIGRCVARMEREIIRARIL